MLAAYWSGVPSRETQLAPLPTWVRRRLPPYVPVDVADAHARWQPLAVALRRVGRGLPRGAEQAIDFLACRAFDRRIAHLVKRNGARAVVACEISALETFRAAKKLGMTTILDAPSVHYAVQDRVTPIPEASWLHQRIIDVKRAEIALADHVLTVSELARRGYIEAGVPASRVHAVPLGADTQLFAPGAPDTRNGARAFTFLFVGATIHRKGLDLLLEAFGAVRRRCRESTRLVIVGPRGDAHALLDLPGTDDVFTRAPVAQSELVEIYRSADCFVLPSRHDSFGMVVLEAMACGLPAIVSEMVGAREALEEGKNGWIVPFGDAAALAERMSWCVENPIALSAMRPAARAAAERYDWSRYGERLGALITEMLGPPR